MGCHTWFYKPTSKTREQLRDETLINIQNKIDKYKDPNYIEHLLKLGHTNHPFTRENIKDLAEYWERWFRRISSSKPMWQAATYSYQIHGKLSEYKNGIFYEEHKYHDLFRGGWYDTPDLHSLDDTLQFCSEKQIELTTDAMLSLFHFFYSHPVGGLITFG